MLMKRIILAIILSLAMSSGGWAGQMVLNLDMEETGGNLNSKATGAISCTAGGGLTYQQDGAPNRSKAVLFNGSTGFFNCGNPTALDITGSAITVMAWVNSSSISTQQRIVDKTNSTATLGYENTFSALTAGRFCVLIPTTGGQITTWKEHTTSLQSNKWYHTTMVYDGSFLYAYVNAVGGASNKWAATGTITSSGGNLAIGRRPAGSNLYYLSGLIDSVKVYNYALTATEIQHQYQQARITTELKHEPWKFTELYKLAFHINGGALHEKDRRISYLRHITN